jgi:hypothetical protein
MNRSLERATFVSSQVLSLALSVDQHLECVLLDVQQVARWGVFLERLEVN